MLNPDTNSDSPSAKSKGVRLVSARHVRSQSPTSGIKSRGFTQYLLSLIIILTLSPLPVIKSTSKINANLTSYDTV